MREATEFDKLGLNAVNSGIPSIRQADPLDGFDSDEVSGIDVSISRVAQEAEQPAFEIQK